MNTIMMIACKSFVSFLMFTPQAAGDIYIHSLLTDLQTAETEGAELQVTIKLDWNDHSLIKIITPPPSPARVRLDPDLASLRLRLP